MLVKKVFRLKNLRYGPFVFLASCIENAPLDSLSPEGPYARSIDELFWITFWIAVGIFAIVQGALLISIFIFKEKEDSPEPKQIHGTLIFLLSCPFLCPGIRRNPTKCIMIDCSCRK